MAVKEELIIEARAETSGAEQGLARVAKAAVALADSEKELATSGVAASDAVDELGIAAAAAEKQIEGAKKETREFYDTFKQVESGAEDAKKQVGAIGIEAQKAGEKFGSASTEGKKFTAMLREVGDNADVAVGSVVGGIGGSAFIGALGGAGIAFAGVKAGAEAFLDSSEALFRSYGPEGMAIWDDLEKSIFAIKGAFAEAVLGGGSVEQMGARLKGIFDGLKAAIDFALSGLKFLSGAFVDNSDQANQAATATSLWKTATEEAATVATTSKTTIDDLTRSYLALTNQVDAQKLAQIGLSLASIRKEQSDTWASEKAMDEARAQAEVAAQREKIAHEAYLEDQAPKKRVPIYPGASTYRIEGETITLAERIKNKMDIALAAAREKQKEVTVETRLTLERLGSLYNDFGRLYAAVGTQVAKPITPNGAAKPDALTAPVDELLYVQELAAGGYAKITEEQYKAAIAAQEMTGDFSTEYLEMRQSEFDKIEEFDIGLRTVEMSNLLARVDEETKAAEAIAAAKAAVEEAARAAKKEAEEKLAKDIAKEWSKFGENAEALGLQNLQDALSGIGTTLGSAARSGEDFGDALGATMESLVGQIAGQWGDLFLKQGIGLMFLDPVAGAGLLAAGIGLKALSGFMSGGDTTTDTGSTGASGVQASATTTTVARPEASFGYFEGGRSPVTIVTNDAASIRTMQHRLDFVSARGGSGV